MPTAPARAYAMKAREDQNAPEVIAGIFSLYDIEMHALIDPGSTHSYVCMEHVFDKVPVMEKLAYDMHVTSPLGHNVSVNSIYRNFLSCPTSLSLISASSSAAYVVIPVATCINFLSIFLMSRPLNWTV